MPCWWLDILQRKSTHKALSGQALAYLVDLPNLLSPPIHSPVTHQTFSPLGILLPPLQAFCSLPLVLFLENTSSILILDS